MARALRLEFEGALYHITSRGNRKEDIYDDDFDRRLFLVLLGEVCTRYNWQCHAYCLMTNHYHLLIETGESNLSKGMRQLNGVYSLKYNQRHERVGHVLQGRYNSIIVEKQTYLLELVRYVVLNPVRAKMIAVAEEWPWSSHQTTLGLTSREPWLNVDWVLSQFSRRRSLAIKHYADFVNSGIELESPLTETKNQIFLGSEDYLQACLKRVNPDADLMEIPKLQRRELPWPLSKYQVQYPIRNEAIVKAYESGGYTLTEVGTHFGISYSMVSRIVNDSKFKT